MMPQQKAGMLSPPNIIITGSWRSGTTLLYMLFPVAFADVVSNGRESPSLETLLPMASWRVSKSPNDIHHVREIVRQITPEVLIYMQRDPRDCIVSWDARKGRYHLHFGEWLRNFLFALSFKNGGPTKQLFIKFEHLIKFPDAVQIFLEAQIPGLKRVRPFSECWREVDSNGPIAHQLAHGRKVADPGGANLPGASVRPMDESVIGAWRQDKRRVREQLEQYPEMQAVLELMGYEEDAEWQTEL